MPTARPEWSALLVLLLLARHLQAGETPAGPPANVLGEMALSLLNSAVDRSTERTRPIRDCFEGTSVSGVGHTRGQSHLELCPDRERAALDLVVVGKTLTRTRGRNRPLTMYFHTSIDHTVRQRLLLDEKGFHALPPTACARSESDMTCMDSDYGCLLDPIVRRIAYRAYLENKSYYRSVSDRRTEANLERDMAVNTAREVKAIQEDYDRGLEAIRKRGIRIDRLRYATTELVLHAAAVVHTGDDRPVLADPPVVPYAGEMKARAHESVATHLLRDRLRGKTLKADNVQAQIADLFGIGPDAKKSAPGPQKDEKEEEPSVTLTDDPVQVSFEKGKVVGLFRVKEFKDEDGEVYPGMNVTVRYVLRETAKGWEARREEKVEVYPPGFVRGKTKLNTRQVATRTILEKRLSKSFPQRVEVPDVTLPGDLKKAGPMKVAGADAQKGWLLVAWRRATASPASSLPLTAAPPTSAAPTPK